MVDRQRATELMLEHKIIGEECQGIISVVLDSVGSMKWMVMSEPSFWGMVMETGGRTLFVLILVLS